MDGGSALRLGLCCTIAASGAVVLAGACGDGPGEGPPQIQALEQSLCHKLIDCGCSESLQAFGLQPPLDCNGWTLESLIGPDPYYYGYGYEGYGEPEEQLPITLDVECVERLADALDAADCGGTIPLPCEERCNPYFGPRFEGEECHREFDCGRGLVCAIDECRKPCDVRPASEGQRCDRIGCEDGLLCTLSVFDYPVCIRAPGPGSPCDMGDCAAGAWCDGSGNDVPTCRVAKDLGAPCMGHRECTSFYCPAGHCAERPGAGRPCGVNGACAEGTSCVADGVCVATPPVCQAAIDLVPF